MGLDKYHFATEAVAAADDGTTKMAVPCVWSGIWDEITLGRIGADVSSGSLELC